MEFGSKVHALSRDHAQVAVDALRYKGALGLFSSGTFVHRAHRNRYDRAAGHLEAQIERTENTNGEVSAEPLGVNFSRMDEVLAKRALDWVIRFGGVVSVSYPEDLEASVLTKDRKTAVIEQAPAVLEQL
ncbi:MAG TPA: hypothetical protein VMU97_01855 [Candidatus Dormibacteraeota bacterium]|nr:hypothetical protein [Candidatus Dormibacteraeota bacterium]